LEHELAHKPELVYRHAEATPYLGADHHHKDLAWRVPSPTRSTNLLSRQRALAFPVVELAVGKGGDLSNIAGGENPIAIFRGAIHGA
jgi:hypothetical protein